MGLRNEKSCCGCCAIAKGHVSLGEVGGWAEASAVGLRRKFDFFPKGDGESLKCLNQEMLPHIDVSHFLQFTINIFCLPFIEYSLCTRLCTKNFTCNIQAWHSSDGLR